jgi:hypothetical protein
MVTIIDAVENYLGNEQSLDNLDELQKLSKAQILQLREEIMRFGESLYGLRTEPSLIQPNEFKASLAIHEIIPWGRNVRRLKNFLLYYPRLVVADPLYAALYLGIFGILPGTMNEVLIRNLRPLLLIKPLIQQNIIQLVPPLSVFPEFEHIVYEINSFDEGDINIDEFAKHLPPEIMGYETKYFVYQMLMKLNEDIVAADYVGANFVAINQLQWDIYKHQLENLRQQLAPCESVRLSAGATIQRIEIPNLDRIGLKDIVELRQKSNAFEEWRLCIGKLLKRLSEYEYLDDIRFNREFNEIAREELFDKAKILHERINNSSLKKHLKGAATVFTLGAVAAEISTLPLEDVKVLDELIKLGIAGGIALLFALMFKRKGKEEQILLKYYSMFIES